MDAIISIVKNNATPVFIGAIATIFAQCVLAVVAHHFRKEEECRRAARFEVAKRMDAIGSNMYSMLACCDIYLKRCKDHPKCESLKKEQQKLVDESLRKWHERIRVHSSKLSEALDGLRYVFWNESMAVESAIRLLIKFASWIAIYRYRPDEGSARLEVADNLRKILDEVIMRTFRTGTLPGAKILKRVERSTIQLDDRKGVALDDEVIAGLDFVIPQDIIVRCKAKINIGSGNCITDDDRIKIYEELIRTLDRNI